MGGLAGHMYHLYDNPSLTFRGIKDIFRKAAAGQLVGTEKADGQNVYISFSARTGTAKAARNKTDIKEGGLSAAEMAARYADKGELKSTFFDAITHFENTIKKLPLEVQIDIFGPSANIYFNAEVQDPRTSNVVLYDSKNLIIHRTGHAEYDKTTGEVIDRNLSRHLHLLESVLQSDKSAAEKTDYAIQLNAVKNLKALSDETVLHASLAALQREMSVVGVGDDETIAQYIINRLDRYINLNIPHLPVNARVELLKRLMKIKGSSITSVIKSLPPTHVEAFSRQLRDVIADETHVLKQAIAPLEHIIHDFAVSMLSSLESAFILDNKREVQRLRAALASAKRAIESSGNNEALEVLKTQFAKIRNIENINTAVEGFVFSYDGVLYKLTGNFAPVNQILGLLKYSKKGEIKPLTEAAAAETDTAVVVYGRFNPPTIGHAVVFDVAQQIATQYNGKLFIFPSRKTDNKKNPLSIDEKVFYLQKMFPNIKDSFISDPDIIDIFDVARVISKAGYTNFILVVGADRVQTFEKLRKYNHSADYDFNNIAIISAGDRDADSDDARGMSASKMRQAALQSDIEAFRVGLGDLLSPDDCMRLFDLVRSRLAPEKKENKDFFLSELSKEIFNEVIVKSGDKYCLKSKSKDSSAHRKNLGCYPSRSGAEKRERQVQYFKQAKEAHVSEVSGMSGAGIEGSTFKVTDEVYNPYDMSVLSRKYGDSAGKREDTTQKALYSEEEDGIMKFKIDRKSFLEELELRKHIREAVRRKEQQKKAVSLQEQQLRQIIRKLLSEGDEDVPHSSTGINVLEDLLKKIIPVVERDFKAITTDQAQRQSFRAHIINAVKNSLAPEQSLDDSETNVSLKEQDSEDAIDPKFIDIGLKKKQKPEETDTFTIPGQDTTGRNMALRTYDKIGKNILNAYDLLSNEKDRVLFYDYLITNLKLYFDKFSSELNPDEPEPDSDIYQKEKQKVNARQSGQSAAPSDLTRAPSCVNR